MVSRYLQSTQNCILYRYRPNSGCRVDTCRYFEVYLTYDSQKVQLLYTSALSRRSQIPLISFVA